MKSYSYEQLLDDTASLAVIDLAREGRLDEATLDRIDRIARAFERQPLWLAGFVGNQPQPQPQPQPNRDIVAGLKARAP